MENFFSATDLDDVLKELEAENPDYGMLESEEEVEASTRRYEEIIKKHRAD